MASLQRLMVQRYHQEVDPHEAFLCDQQQAHSNSSRVQGKAPYIRGWEHNWDRLAGGSGLRSQSGSENETSPPWDSRLSQGTQGDRDARGDGTGRGIRGSDGNSDPCNGSNYGLNLHGGGSRQGRGSSGGTQDSLQVIDGSAAPSQKYNGVLPRRSKSA